LNWTHNGNIIDTPPDDAFGFIYCITYSDGKRYVGKKNFYKRLTLPALKTNKKRAGHTSFIRKRKNNRLALLEITEKESDWKTYEGSSQLTTDKEIVCKEIIDIAKSKRHLTYLEVKHLFVLEVLEKEEYLNENINRMWYKGNLT